MLNWIKKWWNPEPVYSEEGQRLWELLQNEEEWDSAESGQKLYHRASGVGIDGGWHQVDIWFWQLSLGVRVGVKDSSWGWVQFTKDDHKRLYARVAEIVDRRVRQNWSNTREQAVKEVREALGLESKQ